MAQAERDGTAPERYEAHVDLIVNQWVSAYQQRIGQVRVWGTSWHAEQALKLVGEHMDSSYFTVSEPHSDAECPFAESERLDMVVTSYKDGIPVDWAAMSTSEDGRSASREDRP